MHEKMKKHFIPLMVFVLLFVLLPEIGGACPNCKESYMEGDGQSPVSSGFNTSIVFMMMMPFLVIGGVILRLWIARRRAGTTDADDMQIEEAH